MNAAIRQAAAWSAAGGVEINTDDPILRVMANAGRDCGAPQGRPALSFGPSFHT
jgi:hypothetical protein